MAESVAPSGEMKRTLTLTGVTVNAMALIAPGAFLWTTFQAQAALSRGRHVDRHRDVDRAVVLAHPGPAHRVQLQPSWPASIRTPAPARATTSPRPRFLDKENPSHRRFARFAKLSRRLGEPPVLLDLPGHHGRVHRDPVRLHLPRSFHHNSLSYLWLAVVAVVVRLRCRLHRLPRYQRLDDDGHRRSS